MLTVPLFLFSLSLSMCVCSFPFLPWCVVVCWEGEKRRAVIIVHRILGGLKTGVLVRCWAFQGGGGGWVWGIGLNKGNHSNLYLLVAVLSLKCLCFVRVKQVIITTLTGGNLVRMI